jgi:predicted nucleic acid-binding protein
LTRRLAIPDPIVSNTTALITLVGVGRLDLLPQLYGEIRVPDIVAQEYNAGARPGDPDLHSLPWLKIVPVPAFTVEFDRILDVGEIAVINLALSVKARVVLIDEKFARAVAAKQGLLVVGTLSVLARAKRQHLIAEVKPVVDEMIAQGRYIHKRLRDQFLTELGENV